MSKEFFDIEKHPIANNLNLLINYLKKLKRIKGSNFFLMYFFFNISIKVEEKLKKNYTDLKVYKDLIDQSIQEIKLVISGIKNFGFKDNKSNFQSFKTEEYYGKLFKDFSYYHYFIEPKKLLFERLKKNNINLKIFNGADVLDFGCGNGRYTNALQKLKCKNIVGLDKSKENIKTARNNTKSKNINFIVGDVLQSNIKEKYNIVYCNGVLHHTSNILLGLKNIYKALKKNGYCIIYLVSKGGLHWAFVQAFRKIFKDFDKIYAQNFLEMSGLKKNKVFYLMDHVFVKHNKLTSIAEVESLFYKARLKIIKRMNRGVQLDDSERLYKARSFLNKKHIYHLYGQGDHRYLLQKI
jgi:2-polyprenyl-3-methyl-5-hydroxy-6-metoxy-1,4-benzoquinol methylase